MPDGNGNGTSGGTGEETDWGALINDVGGLVDELFDGDFWQWIAGLGCMSSDFKLRDLKDRFPIAINAMRSRSGVDVSMTEQNVDNFIKRLYHHRKEYQDNPGGGCRGTYSQKVIEMLDTYISELQTLLGTSGFQVQGQNQATNFNQQDIGGYMFEGSKSFSYPKFVQVGGGGNVTVIDPPDYNGGGPFGTGTFSPTMSSFNVMNYALGGLLLFGFYKYAKDNKMLK